MTKGRLEAFSDGVIAVIITIMVLELKVPHGTDLPTLRPLAPTFLTYVTAARTLDFVIYGLEEYTAITIVSANSDTIRERIIAELQRGVTVYKGYGGMTGAEQRILYCVVTRLEIGKVKSIVRAIDETAFVVSHALADVDGGVVKRAGLH